VQLVVSLEYLAASSAMQLDQDGKCAM